MATVGDRDNFSGDIVLTAPTGGVTRGLIYNIQNSYVVARETAAAAASFLAAVRGPVWVTKVTTTGTTLAIGQKCYFVSASKKVSSAGTGNTLLGAVVLQAAAAADAKVLINLEGMSPALT
ncbi:capsid cement protein [Methylibium sp.]|uniref:capsid cement protein n=1 Tax=Methylibium sp. TaxID=2067992 RepID=UPI001854DAFB|nr:capsid cement protein [Methylibium sp.]MBA3589957.1 DUF2190 family protein [Methylibium sp.]